MTTETKELVISEELKRKLLVFKKRATARDKRTFCRNGNTLRYWQSQ